MFIAPRSLAASKRIQGIAVHASSSATSPTTSPTNTNTTNNNQTPMSPSKTPPNWSSTLQNIPNARDLAEASPKIIPCRVFRCGSPANATIADIKLVRQHLAVQQMIDLRSSSERAEDKSWPLMLSNGAIKDYDEQGRLVELSVDNHPDLDGTPFSSTIQLHRLSLLERHRFIRAIVWKLPFRKTFMAGVYKVLGWEDAMRDTIIPEINKGGLRLIYEILLETAGPDICRAMEIITDAAVEGKPQMVFCKLGKDRTGVMTALILSVCGMNDDEIIADYARSDGIHKVALGGLEKMRDVQGMDEEIFSRAPPDAMRGLMEWSRERWGGRGLVDYLICIGFGEERQRQLRLALTTTGSDDNDGGAVDHR